MVSRVNIVGYDCGVEYDPDGYYVKYADYAALKAENERLTKERNALTRSNARMQAERALAERAGGVKVTQTYILREWFGGERYARDYEYLDANYGKQASRVVEWLSTLTTEPAAPEGQQEPVAYLSSRVLSSFDPNGAEIVDAMLFPKGCLRPNQEVAIYTRPAEQAVTEADKRRILAVFEIEWKINGLDPLSALRAAMEAGR